MAARKYKFSGKGAWFHHLFNTDEYGDKTFWKLNFYPDDVKAFKATGTKLHSHDDDGSASGVEGVYYTIRKMETEVRKGKKVTAEPPVVIYDGEIIEEQITIGNGSGIEIEIEVYDTKKFGKGTRLNKVKIVDMIEYNPPEDVVDDEEVEDEPEEEPKPAPKKSKKVVW